MHPVPRVCNFVGSTRWHFIQRSIECAHGATALSVQQIHEWLFLKEWSASADGTSPEELVRFEERWSAASYH